jgi:hypothetical protein
MRVRLIVTLDVDEEAWESAYGEPVIGIRSDVRTHLDTTLRAHYVDDLGLAREVVVRRT